jgi:hypothetical protein
MSRSRANERAQVRREPEHVHRRLVRSAGRQPPSRCRNAHSEGAARASLDVEQFSNPASHDSALARSHPTIGHGALREVASVSRPAARSPQPGARAV